MQTLKAKILQQQAKQEALKAAQQVQQQRQKQQQEMEQRKSRLNSAFGSAFAGAAKAAAAAKQQAAAAAATAAAAAAASGTDVDAEEVKRVLACKSHYEVLQLQPGCGSAVLKKRYREMAVRLHPDKCKAEKASDAFQRAHTAYQELLRVVL
jgi:DnaJ-class molecular chaperone